MFEAIHWPEGMTPSRSPIHFTNEGEVKASPGTIWSLLTDPQAWPSFYPGATTRSASARGSRPTWPARTSLRRSRSSSR